MKSSNLNRFFNVHQFRVTGKSLSEALTYFCMWQQIELAIFSCTELIIQWTIFCHIMGLVDARISASGKDLPVLDYNNKLI